VNCEKQGVRKFGDASF